MALPRALCIGAQKAGTSWLHENLKSNPDVWLPPFKEVHFFDHRFLPDHRRWIRGHVSRGLQTAVKKAEAAGDSNQMAYLGTLAERPMMTRNWYRRVFASCPDDRVGIDITPEYASIPEEGVDYVRSLLGPDLRVIYLIRDPVGRALSQLRMYIGRRKKMPASVEDWDRILAEPDLFDRGNYSSHIPRWEAAFPVESFIYIPFGRIISNPLGVLQELEAFCDLSGARYPQAFEQIYRGPSVEFPRSVVDSLTERLADQTRFLEARFGKAFLEASQGER